MSKTRFFVLTVLALLLVSPAVAREDKPARNQAGRQGGRAPRQTRRTRDSLSPEERAKLRERWQNMSEQEKAQFKAKMQERAAGDRGSGPRDPRAAGMAQIARLKEQHKVAVGELQAVKQLAIKENAKETGEALAKLIARHEKQFNQQMETLQRRLKASQGDPAGKPDSEKKADKEKSAGAARKPKQGDQEGRGRERKPREGR